MSVRKRIHAAIIALAIALLASIGTQASAHTYSQESIFVKTYNSASNRYFVGSEATGWMIDEAYHTNGTTLSFSFYGNDAYLTNAYKSYVLNGASKWSGIVNIVNKADGSGTGKIRTCYLPNTQIAAAFYDYHANASGHLTSW